MMQTDTDQSDHGKQRRYALSIAGIVIGMLALLPVTLVILFDLGNGGMTSGGTVYADGTVVMAESRQYPIGLMAFYGMCLGGLLALVLAIMAACRRESIPLVILSLAYGFSPLLFYVFWGMFTTFFLYAITLPLCAVYVYRSIGQREGRRQ